MGQYAYGIVNDIHSANDIAETVFLKLWEQRTTVPDVRLLRGYLLRATRNEALTYIKKLADRREISYSFNIEIFAAPEKANNPQIIAHREELQKIILTCIEELTPRQREVTNHILANANISVKALGRAVGCSYQNVQGIICRVRDRFRKIYKLLKE